MKKPVIDLHCDLLSYLTMPDADPYKKDDIGCALPFLAEGNVKLQVMAIFAPTEPKSHDFGIQQADIFQDLNENDENIYAVNKTNIDTYLKSEKVGMMASIESGAAFCDDHISLKDGFDNFNRIKDSVGEILYVSLTHHSENRFGGGNYTDIGLKKDGKAFLEFLSDQNIAVDFSHTSDLLAEDILEFNAKNSLGLRIIASHSNYRKIWDHPRNLPDEFVQEIIQQNGLIGLNFLRAFVDNDDPNGVMNHLEYGLSQNAKDQIAYGVDFYYTLDHPDKDRIPFYYPGQDDATTYVNMNAQIAEKYSEDISEKVSYKNADTFIRSLWNV